MRESWRDRISSWLAGPAWSLPAYLGLALLLRLPAVLFADGYDFADQQYQYIDPAWNLATGAAWHRPWEWIDRVRGEGYPWLLAGIFRFVGWLGCSEPMATLRAVRGVHAVLSLLPLWCFWLVVTRWIAVAAPRLPLLLFAGSGLLIAGVQPNAPAVGAMLATTAALALAGSSRFIVLAGFCLGLAFCCRFQDALFGPGMLGVLLWQRRWRDALWFALACAPGVVLQGALDLAAGDAFLGTPWRYVTTNLGGAASKWRTQPFWFYWLAGFVPVVALVPGCLRAAWTRLTAGAALLPATAAAAVVHLVAHSFVARKALRFELGALAMLVAVVAVGLPRSVRWSHWHTRLLVVVHVALFVGYSFWFGNAGAVRMAMWLREQPGFDGRIAVIDGDATALGGFFHLRPPSDEVLGMDRRDLAAKAASIRAPFLVAVRLPLADAEAAALGYEWVATFCGQFDLREGERRYVYRRRARRGGRRAGAVTCRLPCRRPSCPRPSPSRPSSSARRRRRWRAWWC